ncbi:hypothetical protein BEWA_029780 [Theileria equi strain WA]|uniref:U3 small nucleolar RNA-associated protein 20 domain-containing protein n=1 Tax=Theileria equi strain WA TaxID=1537102 RepID=L0AX08_THEEQ|nr:hypothetical protein BEWA_029780 [Theileria equi strain WA]AFZ80127.1 hypothetical protein BEWA_029780 [Theileria equi strain WA]|eukprot:XP_004829793.1 hypothetical protein BEWA_029780 [Theileria equi strain WA]
MTQKGRFKFQSSAKVAKSVNAVPFDDILAFKSDDARGCFGITLRNLLRLKDLLKYKQELKEVQRLSHSANELPCDYPEGNEALSSENKVVQVLLGCAKVATPVELEGLFRLLAAYFKDFGASCSVPLVDILKIVEQNPDVNSKSAFSFLVTFFKAHTTHVLKNIESLIKDFLPWLNHRNGLIRRLSMESLGILLRRSNSSTIENIIAFCIHMDGSEKIILAMIQNIDGNFTSKMEHIFVFILTRLVDCNPESQGENVEKVVDVMRKCIASMKVYSKGKQVDLAWLNNLYDEHIFKLSQDQIAVPSFRSLCIVLELCLEMFISFKYAGYKGLSSYPLIADGVLFSVLLKDFVVPLIIFSKENAVLFEEICTMLLRVVRSSTEATRVLDRDFNAVIEAIDYKCASGGNMNPFLSLFEWRLKSDEIEQISSVLVLFAKIFNDREVFHPFLINPSIVQRIVSFIRVILNDISASNLENGSAPFSLEGKINNLFSCTSGLYCIFNVRKRLKSAPPLVVDDALLSEILEVCLRSFYTLEDKRVVIKLYAITCDMVKERSEYITKLLSLVQEKDEMLNNWTLIEFLHKNFTNEMHNIVQKVVTKLPCEDVQLRLSIIMFVQKYLISREIRSSAYLEPLLEFETLSNTVANGRKKCLLMQKSVNVLDVTEFKGAGAKSDDIAFAVNFITRILVSQYFVKFSPLWQGCREALSMLAPKIKPVPHGGKLVVGIWDCLFEQLENLERSKEAFPELPKILEEAIGYERCERTDATTLQSQLLQIMSHLISEIKDRNSKIQQLVDYTYQQFINSKLELQKYPIAAVASLLQKYNRDIGDHELLSICLSDAIRSNDPKIRENAVIVISSKYKGIDVKRLCELASGGYTQILSLTKTAFEYSLEEPFELSTAIEIRLLVPRIIQHTNVAHGVPIIDYFSSFPPKFVNIVLLELLPQEFQDSFLNNLSKGGNDDYGTLMGIMDYKQQHGSLPQVLTTLHLLIKRLMKHLTEQSICIMKFCCSLLESDRDSPIIVERVFKIMVELVEVYEGKRQEFLSILSSVPELVVHYIKTTALSLPFLLCWTCKGDYIAEFCTRVIPDVFPSIFSGKLSNQILQLANDIYSDATILAYAQASDSQNHPMFEIMLKSAEPLLDSLASLYSSSGAITEFNIIKGITSLPLAPSVKAKALNILISCLPGRDAMTGKKFKSNKVRAEKFKEWRKLLESLSFCIAMIKDEEMVDRIWGFINNCLTFVGEMECRRLASSMLPLLPSQERGVGYLGDVLYKMNATKSRSVDAKLDLDLNVELISDVVQEIENDVLSLKCLHTIQVHALFVIWHNHRDPGVRRSVALLTSAVMKKIFEALRSQTSSLEGIQAHAAETSILSQSIFPFIRRCFGSDKSDDALVCFSIEVLEDFATIFSTDQKMKEILTNRLHSDLLGNVAIVECLKSLRQLQKHKRCKGLKQVQNMVGSNVFSRNTISKLFIPLCLKFLVQSHAVRHPGLSDMSKECIIVLSKSLSALSLVKFLKKLVSTYDSSRLSIVLKIFSRVLQNIAEPTFFNSLATAQSADTVSKHRGPEVLDKILLKLKKMSVKNTNKKAGQVPVPEVFESVGSLLFYFDGMIVTREITKHSRILSKFLTSRDREVRRAARVSLINILKPLPFNYASFVVKELSLNLTKGFQCPVLIFTVYSIMHSVLKNNEGAMLTTKDEIYRMFEMIADELLRMQEKDDSLSKIDEARHPRACNLISLICQYGDLQVAFTVVSFLLSMLSGNLKINRETYFEYSNKFLRRVEQLIAYATSGFILNPQLDLKTLMYKLFFSMISTISGLDKALVAFPKDVTLSFNSFVQGESGSFSDVLELKAEKKKPGKEEKKESLPISSKKEDHYTLYPGAATGRSLGVATAKYGFERHIYAPMLVDMSLRIFSHLLSKGLPEENKELEMCELGVLTCFMCEDVKVQRTSVGCLFSLCKQKPDLVRRFGISLADHLVDRIGSLQYIGSEHLAKDCVRLVCIFFKSKFHDLLFEAWEKSNRPSGLVEAILLQIETNMHRPLLQTPLLKLLIIMLQLETMAKTFDKQLYAVSDEVLVKMLKGDISQKDSSMAPKAVAYALVLLPMEESFRSKWVGMLVKHINASNPYVRSHVLQTLAILLKELPPDVTWKRYALMFAVALLDQLIRDYNDKCRDQMVSLISIIWNIGSIENKNELVDCISHFGKKKEKHSETYFAYFAFLCIKQEETMSAINKLNVLTLAQDFMGVILHEDASSHDGEWQYVYYWLRVLEHILTIDVRMDNFQKVCKNFSTAVWNFAIQSGTSSKHPWISAASLRILSLVLSSKKATCALLKDFDSTCVGMLKPCFKNFSIHSDVVERHRKVAESSESVIINTVKLIAGEGDAKNFSKVASKLCYLLRCSMGRRSECKERSERLLGIIGHIVKNEEFLYDSKQRVTLLKMIISIFRVAHAKESDSSWKRFRVAKTESQNADFAQSLLTNMEDRFAADGNSTEYLKLLSFARKFVLGSRLVRKKKIAIALATNQKRAALRKINRHKRRKR